MIKKWNAVCSWMLTLFLLGHMLTMSIPMLTGGQDYSDREKKKALLYRAEKRILVHRNQ